MKRRTIGGRIVTLNVQYVEVGGGTVSERASVGEE